MGRDLGDADRALQLAGGPGEVRDQLTEDVERADKDGGELIPRRLRRFGETGRAHRGHGAEAEAALGFAVAVRDGLGRNVHVVRVAVALERHPEDLPGRGVDRVDQLVAIVHRHAVDRGDHVTRVQPGLLRRVAREQLVDLGGRGAVGDAEDCGTCEQQDERDDEVGHRAGDDDREPLPGRFGLEVVVVVFAVATENALLLGLGRLAVLALHGAIAADREEIQAVVGAASLGGPLEERGAHAQGEIIDADPVAAGQQEVAVLVQDDQHGEHDQEQQ